MIRFNLLPPIVVAVACLLTYAAAQQKGPAEAAQKPKVPEHLRTLIDQARALPPEFASDALLRIASASEIKAPTRRELLLEAFDVASRSKYSVPERNLPGYEVDTPDGYLARAFRLGLDELSLKSRAVTGLVDVDPGEALRLFERMQAIRIPPSSCSVRLIPDLRDFYKLPSVLIKAFSAKQRKDGDDVLLLTRLIHAAHSAAQAPFVPALVTESASPDDSQLQILVGAVAASLEEMERDDLTFRANYGNLSNNVFRLADLCAQRKISNVLLLTALRSAIIRQLSGDRCGRLISMMDPAKCVASFHTVAEVLFPLNADLEPISADDLKPASIQTPPDSEETYFRSNRSASLMSEIRTLRDERQSPSYNEAEWRQHLAVLLSALNSWNPTEEPSERTYFHEKSVLYLGLQSLNPPPDEERGILRDYLAFLEDQRFRDLGIEWFVYAKDLLPALEKADLRDELLKDPVLAMYSRLTIVGFYP